jgi:hypothetical protein
VKHQWDGYDQKRAGSQLNIIKYITMDCEEATLKKESFFSGWHRLQEQRIQLTISDIV